MQKPPKFNLLGPTNKTVWRFQVFFFASTSSHMQLSGNFDPKRLEDGRHKMLA